MEKTGTVFLAFGITGDLMKNKGLPALFALFAAGTLPANFRLVGVSRKSWSQEEMRSYIAGVILASGAQEDQAALFAERSSFVQGEADTPETFAKLAVEVGSPERLLIYLSVSPDFYAPIISGLGANVLLAPATRLLIEKPFGKDGADAEALEKLLEQYVSEEQIFRIDHYLAKTGAFELAVLNKRDITDIAIYLLEAIGVEDRGSVYDAVGALRDVGQNHMLEMLALAAGGASGRADVLASLPSMSDADIAADAARGQYKGYLSIQGVAKGSKTETYFRIRTAFKSPAGTKVYSTLEAGKRLGMAKKEVVLTYSGGSSRSISLSSGGNEYERLFSDALDGKRELFVSFAEVRSLWKFIDPIKAAWSKAGAPAPYEPGTDTIRSK